MIGYTIRIETFHDFFSLVWNFNLFLFCDLEIFNHNECGGRGDQGDFIDLIALEEFVIDSLIIPFLPIFLLSRLVPIRS